MRHVFAAESALFAWFLTVTALAASDTIVISEFRTRGPNGANDEFVELHNVSSESVSVTGWRVMRSTSGGDTSQVHVIVGEGGAGVEIPAGGFYLLANTGPQGYSGIVDPDEVYLQGIADTGGIGLLDASGTLIDAVGMRSGSAYLEGDPLEPLTGSVNQSYERDNGGCVPNVDTDDNATDFRFNASTSYPQNASTECEGGCDGVVCESPPNLACWDSPGTCTDGSCAYDQLPAGTECSDADRCTDGDACNESGTCDSGTAVVCDDPPEPYCSDANTLETYVSPVACSPDNGCVYTETLATDCPYGCNGTTLECDPNPCTGVTCDTPPQNGCYEAVGECQAGVCVYGTNPEGTACNDGNACTTGEECDNAGHCLGGVPEPIDDNEACTVDACDSETGDVTHDPEPDGTNCDDGNLCNGVSSCSNAICEDGVPVTCDTPPVGGCYESTGNCNPNNGACTYAPRDAGSSCDDDDPCTTTDQCNGNGACQGSTMACPPPDPECVDAGTSRSYSGGSCTDGTCEYDQTDTACPAGCDDTTGLCDDDPCAGVTCDDPPGQCYLSAGTCSDGDCGYDLAEPGTACNDGNPCTAVDQCSAAGACQGTPLLCS